MSRNGVRVAAIDREPANTSRWYLEAKLRGIEVHHSVDVFCDDFTSTQGYMMRDVGNVAFTPDEEQFHVWAAADCGAVDLSSLIAWACLLKDRDLSRENPRRCIRQRCHKYWTRQRSGRFADGPTIASLAAYRRSVEDLREEKEVVVPRVIEVLAQDVDDYYAETLRQALHRSSRACRSVSA